MRRNKSYAVVGLGRFGMSLAATLADSDCDVMVVDEKEENIQQIQDRVTYAVRADVTEPGTLESLGIQNMDVVVIGISENMEASITSTFQAKDLGVPLVIAKAMNPLHGKILERVGADQVIYPESATGMRIARKLVTGNFMDFFELSGEYSVGEFMIPRSWVGSTLSDLNVRRNHRVNVIGVKMGDEMNVNPDPYDILPENATVIVVGKNSDLSKLAREQ